MRPVPGRINQLAAEGFEILLIYPHRELVFSLRRDRFQQNIGPGFSSRERGDYRSAIRG